MAVKVDQMKLPEHLNKRKKLTDIDKEKIREIYKAGSTSTRQLAKEYGVDRRAIQYAIYPERYEEAKKRGKEKRLQGYYKKYYNTEKNRIAVADVRRRKREYIEAQKLMTPTP